MQTYENYQEGYRIALKHYVLLNGGPNKMAEDTHTPSQSLATALHSVTDKSAESTLMGDHVKLSIKISQLYS